MDISDILADKQRKPKEKTQLISQLLLDQQLTTDQLVAFAQTTKDASKATCIEAIEFASLEKPALVGTQVFRFMTDSLTDKVPRIKWESAKVIGNTAHLHPDKLDQAIHNLLDNAEHTGTVVRWSAAFALGQIIKLKTKKNKTLIPLAEAIIELEEKNSIRKIYLDAIKKTK